YTGGVRSRDRPTIAPTSQAQANPGSQSDSHIVFAENVFAENVRAENVRAENVRAENVRAEGIGRQRHGAANNTSDAFVVEPFGAGFGAWHDCPGPE
ncbi:MAG: hypothetical protein ACI9C1_002554, partial [Candidatus Aldehydirespiratoraceae bacterium]